MIDAHIEFQKHPIGFNGHLQTVLGIYLPSKWKPHYTVRRMVRVDTHDFLVIHDNCPDGWEPRDRVVVMLHGLGGCHSSGYMKRISAKLNADGFRTMRVDMRGFGSSKYTCRKHAHVGRSDDLELVLEDITRCCPRSPVTLVGFSFGANIVCKLLAEYGSDVSLPLDSAVAVSPPVDLHRCGENLQRGMARFYDYYFVRNLQRLLWERRKRVPHLQDLPIRKLPDRLRAFDDQLTAPLNGFSGVDEYYTMCSTFSILDQICVPTLLLAADDDPLIPVDMFDNVESSAIQLEIKKSGGHLGFVSKAGEYADRRWMDWRILQWVREIEKRSVELVEEQKAERKRRRKEAKAASK